LSKICTGLCIPVESLFVETKKKPPLPGRNGGIGISVAPGSECV
jgi:hypothetical protein